MREMRGDVRDLFHAFRIALDPGKMMLGLVGLLFSFAGLALVAWGVVNVALTGAEKNNFDRACEQYEVARVVGDACTAIGRTVTGEIPDELTGQLPSHLEAAARAAAARQGIAAPSRAARWLTPTRYGRSANWMGLGLLVAAGLWLAFVWSMIGGAIARIAAVETAKDERLSVNEALHFARHHFSSFFWSPVSVGALIAVLVLGNAFIGLIAAIPYLGDLLGVLLVPMTFVASLVILFLGVGGALGWPLMAPALAAEGTDAFDAVSRSMSYVYGRPCRYVGYSLAAKAIGAVSAAVVGLFAVGVVKVTFFSVGLGMHAFSGPNRKLDLIGDYIFGRTQPGELPVTMGDIVAAHGYAAPLLVVVLAVIVLLIYGLAAGYLVSVWYSLRTLVYFVLRRVEDHTEMDEVWLDEAAASAEGDELSAPAPAPAAGPGLATDPAAAPGLDPAQQAAADEARAAGGEQPTVGGAPEA